MYCYNCGTELEDGSLFCPSCGAKQTEDGPGNFASNTAASDSFTSDGFTSDNFASDNFASNYVAPNAEDPDDFDPNDFDWDDGNGSSGKGKKGLIIGILAVVIVGVGVGVGGYFLYKNISSSKSNTTASKEKDKENEKEKSDKKKEEQKKADAKEEKDADKQDGLKDSVEGTPPKKEESDVKKEKEAPAAPVYEYQVIAQRMTWSEAYTYCQSQGGQLATPSTQEEYNQIVQKANESGLKVLWLGAQRTPDGSGFMWISGDEFSYAQWGAGEPNNDQGNEPRMGMMYVNGSWNLYDMPDDVSQYYSSNIVGFVMEKEVVQ